MTIEQGIVLALLAILALSLAAAVVSLMIFILQTRATHWN
jgi:hypothetical protein